MPRSIFAFALAATLVASAAPRALAADVNPATGGTAEEASRHYRRGVDFYNDKSYEAALTEFRRAYEIAPNFNVLYNIGQIQYLLQDYAGALDSFQRYLQEGADRVPEARRKELDRDLARLRDRVARVEVASNAPDAEVIVDDAVVGRTPLGHPIVVNVGRRRIALRKGGREVASRVVELAAGDRAKVTLDVEAAAPAPVASSPAAPPPAAAEAPPAPRSPWPTVAWITTGALAAGTVVTGVLALRASGDLDTDRHTDGVSRATLDSAQSRTKTLALVTDVLGVATAVSAGVAIYTTVTANRGATTAGGVEVRVVGNGVAVRGSF